MTYHIDFLTLYPEAFLGPLDVSILKRAREQNLWSCAVHNIRDASWLPHRAVDDKPAGGGAGLVLRADVMAAALDAVDIGDRPVIFPSPRGAPFSQSMAKELAAGAGAVFMCGRFEGVDERLFAARNVQEVSLGDFVLAGGEVAAMTMTEAILRLLPGVAGNAESLTEESFENGLLEYPQFTKPRLWEGHETPAVLTSGDHKKVAKWRLERSKALTQRQRKDLWAAYIKFPRRDD